MRILLVPRHRALLPALAVPGLALALAGCADDGGGGSGPEVAVTAYPMQFVAERVLGDAGTVTSVAPAGTEPHDLELSPSAVATLDGADAVLYLSDFQTAVDDALAEVGSGLVVDAADHVDLLTGGDDEHDHDDADGHDDHGPDDHGHNHGGVDPHFWLDPLRVADLADALAVELGEAEPELAATFENNAATLRGELEDLDERLRTGLAGCVDRTFVTSHEAFGYLAHAYDLTQVGISGIDPEAEPSPARVAEVLAEAREHGVTTVFTQPGGLTAVADVVADELGLTLATLDPIELAPSDTDYLGAMAANLAALREGLSCP